MAPLARAAAKRSRRIIDSDTPESSPGAAEDADEVDVDDLDAEGEEEADEEVEEEEGEDEDEDAEGEVEDEDEEEDDEDEFVDAQDQSAPGEPIPDPSDRRAWD